MTPATQPPHTLNVIWLCILTMNTNLKIFFVLLLCLTLSISCTPMMYDDDLVGKIIDGETSEPIKGAVVLGVWSRWHPSPDGVQRIYYDAHETVTDGNGDFMLDGKGLRIFTNIAHMGATVIKDGYNWKGINHKILSKNNGIVKLYKTSKKQLVNFHGIPVTGYVSHEDRLKIKLSIKEEDLINNKANNIRRKLRETGKIE